MLSRFKISPLEIRQALLSLDDKMSIDDLKAINKQLPSPEEVRWSSLRFTLLYPLKCPSQDRTYKGFRRYKQVSEA